MAAVPTYWPSTNTRGPAVTGQCGEGVVHHRPASMNGICRPASVYLYTVFCVLYRATVEVQRCWPRGLARLSMAPARAVAVRHLEQSHTARDTSAESARDRDATRRDDENTTRSVVEFEPITRLKTYRSSQASDEKSVGRPSHQSLIGRVAVGASSLRVGRRVLLLAAHAHAPHRLTPHRV